jgi:hypothetical protein
MAGASGEMFFSKVPDASPNKPKEPPSSGFLVSVLFGEKIFSKVPDAVPNKPKELEKVGFLGSLGASYGTSKKSLGEF